MRCVVLAALLGLVCAVLASESVVVVTPDNYDDLLDGDVAVFLKVYAPWCGHCKSLAPTWEELGAAFAKYHDRVVIAKLDADAHQALGQQLGVGGFPTLLFFPRGYKKGDEPEKYEGGRDLEALGEFVSKQTGVAFKSSKAPSAVTIVTPENVDEILASGKNLFIEFFAPWCGHCKALAPKWEKLAAAFSRDSNVVIASADCAAHSAFGERFGVSGFPTLKYFDADKPVAEPETYNGGRELADLVAFVNTNAGTARADDGSLLAHAGRVAEYDELAKGFLASKDKAAVAKKAHALGVQSPSTKYYLAAFDAIVKKGDAYVAKEIERLTRMAKDSSITPAKADEFQLRKNVLSAFH